MRIFLIPSTLAFCAVARQPPWAHPHALQAALEAALHEVIRKASRSSKGKGTGGSSAGGVDPGTSGNFSPTAHLSITGTFSGELMRRECRRLVAFAVQESTCNGAYHPFCGVAFCFPPFISELGFALHQHARSTFTLGQ